MRIIYGILLCLRFIIVLQPGYIHPDEFFQGGQELFFGCSSQSHSDAAAQTPYAKLASKYIRLPSGYTTPFGLVTIYDTTSTWEFQSEYALRSIIPPTIMTILPLKIYSAIRNMLSDGVGVDAGVGADVGADVGSGGSNNDESENENRVHDKLSWIQSFSGWEILVIPRLAMALLSVLTIDIPIWYVAHQRRDHERLHSQSTNNNIPVELLIVGSSWVTIGFMNRPFSNSLEAMCLALLCMVAVYDMNMKLQQKLQPKPQPQTQYSFLIRWMLIPSAMGVIGSIGVFTRFTFAIFALPIVMTVLYQRYTAARQHFKSTRAGMQGVIKTVLSIGVPFLLTSALFIHHDTIFYASQRSLEGRFEAEPGSSNASITITPWNAFRYNSRVDNLSEHGLHPRITHALVNCPMLYGPLAISFYLSFFFSKGLHKSSSVKGQQIDNMLQRVVVFGLVVLSCAPHQEPRFLLPLSVPLILLRGRDIFRLSSSNLFLKCFWVFFNIVLVAFFGIWHQGGVVPSLRTLPSISLNPSLQPDAIIYYHTYMPPTFLMRSSPRIQSSGIDFLDNDECIAGESVEDYHECSSAAFDQSFNICNTPLIDMQSAGESELITAIDFQLQCSSDQDKMIYVTAPNAGMVQICKHFRTCVEIWDSFQIATEEEIHMETLLDFFENSRLSVYSIKC